MIERLPALIGRTGALLVRLTQPVAVATLRDPDAGHRPCWWPPEPGQ